MLLMHELGIAQSVIDAVQTESARHPGAKPSKVAVRIGELSAIDPDALRFSFNALIRESELEGMVLETQVCPRRHRCLDCGTEFDIKDFDFRCPQCASTRNQCIGGEELELAYMELEEHEPSTA
jgi:hydrogenase nickel incorporation protein HypA/HybF